MWIQPKGWRREVSSLLVFDISLGLRIVCEDLSGDLQKLTHPHSMNQDDRTNAIQQGKASV